MKTTLWLTLVMSTVTAAALSGCSGNASSTSALPGPVAATGSVSTSAKAKSVESTPQHGLHASNSTEILEQYQALLEDYREISRRQEQQIDQLEQTVSHLRESFDRLTTQFETLQPRKQWHNERLDSNRDHYATFTQFLDTLDHELFPLTNTWYSERWLRLTACFTQHRFPTAEQRDELVELIEAIRRSERQRAEMLADRIEQDPAIGYCLHSPWDEALTALRSFEY